MHLNPSRYLLSKSLNLRRCDLSLAHCLYLDTKILKQCSYDGCFGKKQFRLFAEKKGGKAWALILRAVRNAVSVGLSLSCSLRRKFLLVPFKAI